MHSRYARIQRSTAANVALRPIVKELGNALRHTRLGCVSTRVGHVDAVIKFDTASDFELVELVVGTDSDHGVFAGLHVDAMVHDGPCLPADLNHVGVAIWTNQDAADILADPYHLQFLVG